jgi:hypothetical protein
VVSEPCHIVLCFKGIVFIGKGKWVGAPGLHKGRLPVYRACAGRHA